MPFFHLLFRIGQDRLENFQYMLSRDISACHLTDELIGIRCDRVSPLVNVFCVSPTMSLRLDLELSRPLKSHDIIGCGSRCLTLASLSIGIATLSSKSMMLCRRIPSLSQIDIPK